MLTLRAPQFKLLERLCNAVAVSGDEAEVRGIVLEAVKPYADEVRVDALGSVLVRRSGRGRARPRVLLDAHMDEVGFMIVEAEGDGIYRFELVGVIDPRLLAGKQVLVGRAHTPGVIGVTPIHLLEGEAETRSLGTDSLRIDLGPGGRAEVGERASFATRFRRAGPSILAKSIDDRIGVAILIELLRHAPDNIDLCLSFSVQEEIGLMGAQVSAHAFDPDLAFAIDSTPARDLPAQEGSENTAYNTKLGLGPAIYVADKRTIHDPGLVRFLQQTALEACIPFQIRQPGGGGTDSGGIQPARSGVRTVSVSVPHRYTHSPISISRVEDWKNTLNLMDQALRRITPRLAASFD